MPYVTSTRSLSGTKLGTYKYRYVPDGSLVDSGASASEHLPGFESTYSWRTNRNKDRGADTEYEELSGPELAKRVGDEYHTTRGGFDTGHEFNNQKSRWYYTPTRLKEQLGSYSYDGWITPYVQGSNVNPVFSTPTQSEYNQIGAGAIARSIPTRPEAGLAAFLGELREGIPRLLGASFAKNGFGSRGAGDEYLNTQFGIVPFKSDVEKMLKAVSKGDILLSQFEKDINANVRRNVQLSHENTVNRVGDQYLDLYIGARGGNPQPFGWINQYSPQCSVVDTVEQRMWFAGCYTYYLPVKDLLDKLSKYPKLANKLLGTELTPDVLWQITPWSWLIDWFGNFNTLLTNVSYLQGDSCVLRYGYLMHETHAWRTWTTLDPMTNYYGQSFGHLTLTHEIHVKNRVQATPYGFGIHLPDLSPARLAILAALGLTRAPGISMGES